MNEISIYKSSYHKSTYAADSSFIRTTWHTPDDMSESAYRQELINYFDCVKQYKPKIILLDAVDTKYVISVETQVWIAENLLPIYKEVGVKKMAVLLSTEIFMAASIQQAIDEGQSDEVETQYFENNDLAIEWLLN